MFLQYVHDVNAKVEADRRYLSDVVQVKLDKETVPAVIGEDEEVVTPAYDQYRVTAYPAIKTGTETVTSTPVHPKTEGISIESPVYSVPEELKILVRLTPEEIKQDTAGAYANNWKEEVVTVHPLVDEVFSLEQITEAQDYYAEVIHQLEQGDIIRHYNRSGVVGSPYDNYNSRYHSF